LSIVIEILSNLYLKQGMVLRSELLSVISECKNHQDDAEAKAKQIAWLEQQLSKAQDQIATIRKEAAQLRVDHGGMVHRSELEALQAEIEKLDCSSKVENKRQRELFQALNEKFSVVDTERAELANKIQVCV
jgi:predicted  nucleic acid-binding Zn-ribbon protein